jgi:hypothetical protein
MLDLVEYAEEGDTTSFETCRRAREWYRTCERGIDRVSFDSRRIRGCEWFEPSERFRDTETRILEYRGYLLVAECSQDEVSVTRGCVARASRENGDLQDDFALDVYLAGFERGTPVMPPEKVDPERHTEQQHEQPIGTVREHCSG